MTPAELIAWRKAHDMTQTAAAEALGVSRRALGAYEGDGGQVPKLVALACRALAMTPQVEGLLDCGSEPDQTPYFDALRAILGRAF